MFVIPVLINRTGQPGIYRATPEEQRLSKSVNDYLQEASNTPMKGREKALKELGARYGIGRHQ